MSQCVNCKSFIPVEELGCCNIINCQTCIDCVCPDCHLCRKHCVCDEDETNDDITDD